VGDKSLILPAKVAGKLKEIMELEGAGIGAHGKRA
jgi:hypothetical protein